MKWSCSALVVLAVVGLAPSEDRFDLRQSQFPPRPTPKWLRTVDLGTTDPRLKGYRAPEGVKVEIVADSPTVVNPVGLAFDDDGILHVLEWKPDAGNSVPTSRLTFTYRDGSKRDVTVVDRKSQDVVKVLRDSKGVGVYDQAEVILEDELPSSLLFHDGWLYLSGRGTVRRYRRSKPDGPYDVREVIAQGFCGYHRHQVSGMTVGPDGWLYITTGDDDNVVEGSDGSRATVWRTGAVFRCRPDGSRMHVHSLGFCNPYRDVAFDAGYNLFHLDNGNDDGSKFQGNRLIHIVEAGDYGWRLRLGAHGGAADNQRAAVFGELPGKLPALLKTGRGAAGGLMIYHDTSFPELYRGLLYYPDPIRQSIRAYAVVPDGATFRVVEEFDFLTSSDPLFRPSHMVVGPDGAMYVSDWRTAAPHAGQLGGDGKNGRIYRLRWTGTNDLPEIPLRGMDSWSKIRKLSEEDLLERLGWEDFTDRQRARMEVVRRGTKMREAMLTLAADPDKATAARVEAVGALNQFWNEAVRKAFCSLLSDPDPTLRRLAADGLTLNAVAEERETHDALLQVLGDGDPAVRRAVILAMGRIGAEGAADALVNALTFDNGKDVYLRDGLVRAIERLGKPGIERLVELGDSGVDANIDRAVEAVCGLREAPGAAAIPTLLRNPHLNVAQRVALVRSYLNYHVEPPVSLMPLVDYLTATQEKPEVKLAAVDVLTATRLVGGKAVRAEGLTNEKARVWVASLLDDDNAEVRHAAQRAIERTRVLGTLQP